MQTIKDYIIQRKQEIKQYINNYTSINNKSLTLVIVRVGDDPASIKYTVNKQRDCEELGIVCKIYTFDKNIAESELCIKLQELNHDPSVTGYIVQLPLPKHIDEKKIFKLVSPAKDADGFNANSITTPATPLGAFNFLKAQGFEFTGKNALVIGRSAIVGRPMAKLLLDANMNVTVIHSKTFEEDKRRYINNADLIVCATGHRDTLVRGYKYKPDTVIIDVGINFDEDGKICGDCEKDLPVAFQSPVPGGVGLLTRLALIENLLALAE